LVAENSLEVSLHAEIVMAEQGWRKGADPVLCIGGGLCTMAARERARIAGG
jgi:hypothetical protein